MCIFPDKKLSLIFQIWLGLPNDIPLQKTKISKKRKMPGVLAPAPRYPCRRIILNATFNTLIELSKLMAECIQKTGIPFTPFCNLCHRRNHHAHECLTIRTVFDFHPVINCTCRSGNDVMCHVIENHELDSEDSDWKMAFIDPHMASILSLERLKFFLYALIFLTLNDRNSKSNRHTRVVTTLEFEDLHVLYFIKISKKYILLHAHIKTLYHLGS